MKFIVILAFAATLAATSAVAAPVAFRAPQIAPQVLALPAPAKSMVDAPVVQTGGPLHVGDVRALEKSVTLARWEPADNGFVARLRAQSPGAQGLRIRLDLGALPGAVEVRAKGSGSGPI